MTSSPDAWQVAKALELRDYSITEWEFSGYIQRVFKQNGINTFGDLVTKTEEEMLAIHGMGPVYLQEIRGVLALDGLVLGIQLPD